MTIDWFAVDCVLRGTPLPLRPEERAMVVRRLQGRLYTNETQSCYRPDGVAVEQVARLFGVTPRTVERIKNALPVADKGRCDVCGSPMWVLQDGDVIEPHADDFFKQCPMSGQVFEGDWESELANRAVWLARRLRDGDRDGVWEYVERLNVSSMRNLLVAVLAGFDSSDDPYRWLQEVENA